MLQKLPMKRRLKGFKLLTVLNLQQLIYIRHLGRWENAQFYGVQHRGGGFEITKTCVT